MAVPKWLKIFITKNAYTLSPKQLENLDVQSREETLWKYIVMNSLKPKPLEYSYFITSDGDFFMDLDGGYVQVKIY